VERQGEVEPGLSGSFLNTGALIWASPGAMRQGVLLQIKNMCAALSVNAFCMPWVQGGLTEPKGGQTAVCKTMPVSFHTCLMMDCQAQLLEALWRLSE